MRQILWLFIYREGELDLNQNQFLKVILSIALAVFSSLCWGSLVHNNQLVIQKEQPQVLRLEFTVNPVQMLHHWLAPAVPFDIFLKKYAAFSDDAFQKELTKAIKKFEFDSFVIQTSGTKNVMKLTEIPAASELKKMLQQNLLIMDLPSNLQAHLEPIVLRASLKTRTPLQRGQLFIAASVFPIQVRYEQDLLWLTAQIPMALYDF